MKAVLIATDFSIAADNAASYGVELAKALNATATLFNACEHSPLAYEAEQRPLSREEVKGYIMEELAEDARLLSSLHEWPVQTSCLTGNALPAFQEAIRDSSAELVIVGMKKGGKGFQRVLGSTVTGLIGQLDIPMLIVPEEIKFTYLINIALAMSWEIIPEENSQNLDALRELTERFHSRLYFVQVTRSHMPENNHPNDYPGQLAWIKQKMNTEFETITGKDIPASLTKFVQLYDINILVILAHKHSLLKRFLFRNNSRTLAFECPVPLLMLPGRSAITGLTHDADDHQWEYNS